MGNGINIGNSLDAYGLGAQVENYDELSSETLWGNPQIDRELFRAIRQMGLQTVRLPVSWAEHMDENMVISDRWLSRVREVVDLALEEGLYVILDTHHEEWLDLDITQADELERKLRLVWGQIAAYFEDYSTDLLFEGMSEPRLRNSPVEWTSGTDSLRQLTNRLNRAFVETVRSSGGNNEQRYLLITTYGSNTGPDAIYALEIPDDRCVVSLHFYDPYEFCLAKNGGVKWQEAWKWEIEAVFATIGDRLTSKGVPVVITEFGCIDNWNIEDRVAWTRAVAQIAQAYQIHCIWWDDGGDFAIMDRNNASWKYPEIANQFVIAEN